MAELGKDETIVLDRSDLGGSRKRSLNMADLHKLIQRMEWGPDDRGEGNSVVLPPPDNDRPTGERNELPTDIDNVRSIGRTTIEASLTLAA